MRPLKRQAEAAELHERLERQMLEARWELAREALRASGTELEGAEARVRQAREARERIEERLQAVIARRGQAERALAERAERHDALAKRVYEARSARERLGLREEQAGASAQSLRRRIERVELELGALSETQSADDGAVTAADVAAGAVGGTKVPGGALADARAAEGAAAGAELGGAEPQRDAPQGVGEQRIAALEGELAQIEVEREREVERELEDLRTAREREVARVAELVAELEQARAARAQADELAEQARVRLQAAEREAQDRRREAARVGGELAVANQFLRSHAASVAAIRRRVRPTGAAKALSEELSVRDGYELALAAALGGRLSAVLVRDVAGAQTLLDRAGPDGGSALLAELASGQGSGNDEQREPPVPGAERLLELVSGPAEVMALARRLLADAWVVERLEDLPRDFAGIAATRTGRVWFAAWGEVRQLTEGGEERVLARRNERDRLIAASELAVEGRAGRAGRDRADPGGGARSRGRTHRGRSGAARGRACPRGGRRGAAPDGVADRAAQGRAPAGPARGQEGAAGGRARGRAPPGRAGGARTDRAPGADRAPAGAAREGRRARRRWPRVSRRR